MGIWASADMRMTDMMITDMMIPLIVKTTMVAPTKDYENDTNTAVHWLQ